MFKELEPVDWQKIMEYGQTPDQMIKVPVFMSLLVKHLLQKRKKAVARRDHSLLTKSNQHINSGKSIECSPM